MRPDLVWLVISGSPCQDLTYAGYLNGMLGLTGRRSSLLFVVYMVIYYLQQLTDPARVRYLVENAGSMQPICPISRPRAGEAVIRQSEHF